MPGPGVTATMTNNSNMYRIGDYVYFESGTGSGPYAIRRIEELNKTQNGNKGIGQGNAVVDCM